MTTRALFLAASLTLLLAAPASAQQGYDEFTSETARQRFAWGQQAYPFYCDAPPPPQFRNVRFDDLNLFARGALAFATKQQIADYIENNCGKGQSEAAKYVGN